MHTDPAPTKASQPHVVSVHSLVEFVLQAGDLTAGGFYTTPIGMKDIGYTGNVPLERFDGPPIEALKKAGLA